MNWLIAKLGMLSALPEVVTWLLAAVAGALAAFWVHRLLGTKPRRHDNKDR